MKRSLIVTVSILCFLLFAASVSAQNPLLEKLMLYPVPTNDRVPPVNSPGGSDDVAWTMLTPCPQNFNRCAIGQIGDYVYIMGSYTTSNFAHAFCLSTETWVNTTQPPIDGYNWVGTVADGSMYVFPRVFGGSTVQKFTPTGGGPTGVWTTVADYPQAVGVQTVAWDGGNFIYCAGGTGSAGLLDDAYKYDIANNTYTQIASAPRTLKFSGGAFIGGKFYVVGGLDAGSQSSTDLYEYDPATNTWATKTSSPVATAFTCWATTYNDLYLFIVGGGGGYSSWPAVDAVQVYNPATDTWFLETARPLNTGTNMAVYCDGVNYLVDGGGYDGAQNYDVFWKGTNPPGSSNPLAPGAATGFTVTHNNAELVASLNWTNPTQTVNAQPLTQLNGVYILRDGNQIANITNVQIGQPSAYDDSSLTLAGMYNYRVIAYNDSGEGLAALASAWIGLDTPGEPSNVTATPDPGQLLECTVNWAPPSQGAHNAYWPAGSWDGQKVYRDGVEIANITGTNTSYLDNTVPAPGFYVYGVSYYNSSGEGPVVDAPAVQVGAPDFEQIPFDWVEINTCGTNTQLTGDDQNLGPFPIGFDFPFYDSTYFNSLRVCSNGFACFTSTATAYSNRAIPDPAQPNDLLAVYWDDLQCNVAGANVYYYHDAANDRYVVEWETVGRYGATGSALTFELILYPNGDIDYMYHTLNSSTLNSATVGIENGDGTVGLQTTYNGSGPIEPTDSLGIRIYSVNPQTSDLVVTLIPHNPPIQIPAAGGSFMFDVEITNNTSSALTFDGWTEVVIPTGATVGPLVLRTNLPIAPGQTVMRIVTQNVPGMAPPGNYTYVGNAGTHPGTVVDSDNFPFAKLAGDASGSNVSDWTVTGWFGDEGSPQLVPDVYSIAEACPNPFNPETRLEFSIPEAANVTLTVFDITGREVAVLVEGLLPAGSHSVMFDGSTLASGVYFASFKANDFKAMRKMLLLK